MTNIVSQRRATVLGAFLHGPISVPRLARLAGCTEVQVRPAIGGLRYHDYTIVNVGPRSFALRGKA